MFLFNDGKKNYYLEWVAPELFEKLSKDLEKMKRSEVKNKEEIGELKSRVKALSFKVKELEKLLDSYKKSGQKL